MCVTTDQKSVSICHRLCNANTAVSALCRHTHLVNEILAMVVAQFLGSDNTMQIGFHELLNEIYLSKMLKGWRSENV